jgi:hypothetical protein
LKAICKNHKDRTEEILELLVDRAENDSDEQVREFAAKTLAIWKARIS